jgi:hypothetical protein
LERPMIECHATSKDPYQQLGFELPHIRSCFMCALLAVVCLQPSAPQVR